MARPFGKDRYAFMRPWVERAMRDHGGLRGVCRLARIEGGRQSVQNWLGGRESQATKKTTKRALPDIYGELLLDPKQA